MYPRKEDKMKFQSIVETISISTQRQQVIRDRKYCQQLFKVNPKPQKDIVSNFEEYFHKKSKCYQAVLNYFLYLNGKFNEIDVSQSKIAERVGYSRRQVSRVLLQLMKDGLIYSHYRHLKTCVYELSSFFNYKSKIETVRELSPFFGTLSQNVSQTKLRCNIKKTTFKLLTNSRKGPGNDLAKLSKEEIDRLKHNRRISRIRETMEAPKPIPQVINDIKSLGLTKQAKMQLTVFPDEAIRYADGEMMDGSINVENMFGLFYKFCKGYCDRRSIKLNWTHLNELKIYHGWNNNAPMLTPKQPTRTAKKNVTYHPRENYQSKNEWQHNKNETKRNARGSTMSVGSILQRMSQVNLDSMRPSDLGSVELERRVTAFKSLLNDEQHIAKVVKGFRVSRSEAIATLKNLIRLNENWWTIAYNREMIDSGQAPIF